MELEEGRAFEGKEVRWRLCIAIRLFGVDGCRLSTMLALRELGTLGIRCHVFERTRVRVRWRAALLNPLLMELCTTILCCVFSSGTKSSRTVPLTMPCARPQGSAPAPARHVAGGSKLRQHLSSRRVLMPSARRWRGR